MFVDLLAPHLKMPYLRKSAAVSPALAEVKRSSKNAAVKP